mmetsp:Transcript_12014/g.39545  ORF Transcript_12014/g.39545 Transcript_12014/m.39545 type:complete len:113 (+) Transcript_12014:582-920(+)
MRCSCRAARSSAKPDAARLVEGDASAPRSSVPSGADAVGIGGIRGKEEFANSGTTRQRTNSLTVRSMKPDDTDGTGPPSPSPSAAAGPAPEAEAEAEAKAAKRSTRAAFGGL